MLSTNILKGLKHPIKALRYIRLYANGYYYKIIYKICKKNIKIGKNFKVSHKLSIKGPGKVIIGNNVFIDGTTHTVTPWTYDRNAAIKIGDNVVLSGTRFGCREMIEIGENCLIGDCRILDTDFHSVYPEKRNNSDAVKSAPIKIGRNVWVAIECVILRGVSIGDNSTISARSVVYNNIPEYSLCRGNPAVIIKSVKNEDN